MGKDIGCSYKYIRSKISTPTLKKPVLSSSAAHASYATSLSQTFTSSQLENEDIITIQNTSEILNTDDIHSCVTPRKQNVSVQATSKPPCLTPLINTVTLAYTELPKTTQFPLVDK